MRIFFKRDAKTSKICIVTGCVDTSGGMPDGGVSLTLRSTLAVAYGRRYNFAPTRPGSPVITLRTYGHLFSNADARAAEIMEATFARSGSDDKQRADREGRRWQSGGNFAGECLKAPIMPG
ncbi:MAG: hypothetical protein GEU95_10410 [Rhizobiales bacterium]|nr:hypothetical protein [Hyphomicrobiales bacterium]